MPLAATLCGICCIARIVELPASGPTRLVHFSLAALGGRPKAAVPALGVGALNAPNGAANKALALTVGAVK